ncbi:MAG TPA: lysophospholipase [Verrucomicrobiales bacterium]|nr:lysophospholipase [Verrucomicrobiales bacterium]
MGGQKNSPLLLVLLSMYEGIHEWLARTLSLPALVIAPRLNQFAVGKGSLKQACPILKYVRISLTNMKCSFFYLIGFLTIAVVSHVPAEDVPFPLNAERIVFLGDSITHAGEYITLIEARLRLELPKRVPELINLGLPSETCSGLSEPDHPFPRPDVHERLARALDKAKPDVVVACYGMNDGIYHPFHEDRFNAYRLGIGKLIEAVKESGAALILMTPPAFDPLPMKKSGKLVSSEADQFAWFAIYENYDQEVLKPYAQWVMAQENRVHRVIDLHTSVNRFLDEKRKVNLDFTMSGDGVHVNGEGHQVLAQSILESWGYSVWRPLDSELVSLIQKKQTLLHNAWLSHVGHQRPGMKPGLPLVEAHQQIKPIEVTISEKLRSLK